MLTHPTVDKLMALRLPAFAEALQRQLGNPEFADLSFEDRLGLLVDAEWTHREQRKLRAACAGQPPPPGRRSRTSTGTAPAAAWTRPSSTRCHLRLDRPASQPAPDRPHRHRQVVARRGLRRARLPLRLLRLLRAGLPALPRAHVARGDGSYTRVLARLAKTDLLVIDDWGLAPLTGRRAARPARGPRGSHRARLDPHHQSGPGQGLARR